MTARTDRVDAQLRQEISELLTREIGDPRIGFVTVTDVETSPDLGHARVWISVVGPESERDETYRALRHAMPFIRRRLGERLHLKRIPELSVREDHAGERGTRVLKVLHDLEEGRLPEALDAPSPLPVPRPRGRGARRGR